MFVIVTQLRASNAHMVSCRPLFLAPLSEIFGRTIIYSVSMFIFFIFTLPSALAPNIATLVVSRQIAGIAASAPVTNVGGR